MASALPTSTLTTASGQSLTFSRMGCGGAPFGDLMTTLTDTEAEDLAQAAWAAGIRHFDTAPQYGHGRSERRVGRLVSAFPRDEFLLSTKVGKLIRPDPNREAPERFFHPGPPPVRVVFDYSYDGVMRSFEESLERLGQDRVDILLAHDIDAFTQGSRAAAEARIVELMDQGGWRALDDLRRGGVVRAIGVGVNEWEPCVRMLQVADPDLLLLAGRYTLLEQTPLHTLFPECARRGVGIIAGGPYNSGLLARRGGLFNYDPAPASVEARAERLRQVCERHGVEPGTAAIQFLAANPQVTSILPGHHSIAELEQNVARVTAPTPAALWAELKAEGLIDGASPTPV